MALLYAPIAKQFALYEHRNHYRRDGITPYFTHLEAVANRVSGDSAKAVAWLHDWIEDIERNIPNGIAKLRAIGMPEEVIKAVVVLTKKAGQPYEDYIREVSENVLARIVKFEDMLVNNSDTPTKKQKEKYSIGLGLLMPPDHR
jgi:hypothetical protein